jgi:hypothetical protein
VLLLLLLLLLLRCCNWGRPLPRRVPAAIPLLGARDKRELASPGE